MQMQLPSDVRFQKGTGNDKGDAVGKRGEKVVETVVMVQFVSAGVQYVALQTTLETRTLYAFSNRQGTSTGTSCCPGWTLGFVG